MMLSASSSLLRGQSQELEQFLAARRNVFPTTTNATTMTMIPSPATDVTIDMNSPARRQLQTTTDFPELFSCIESAAERSNFICLPTFGSNSYYDGGIDSAFGDRLMRLEESVEYEFFPAFFCDTDFTQSDTITTPTTDDDICQSECLIRYRIGGVFDGTNYDCTSCALVGAELIYDCRNVLEVVRMLENENSQGGDLPNENDDDSFQQDALESCASRQSLSLPDEATSTGEESSATGTGCGDYVHWTCYTSGLGFACFNTNRLWLDDDFLFPFDEGMQSRTDDVAVYCSNDISGRTVQECKNPECLIGNVDPPVFCNSCRVLLNDMNVDGDDGFLFAYDCGAADASQEWGMNCPILDEAGKCQEYVDPVNISRTVSVENVKGISSSTTSNGDDDRNNKKWTWTIRNIDPTSFNVLADVFGFFTRIVFGVAFAAMYPLLLTWQLGRFQKPLSVHQLAVVPGDVIQAIRMLPSMAWSLPAILAVSLLSIVDFSHTIAMFGFDFIDEIVAGPPDTVLRVSTTSSPESRNSMRPFQSAGDPDLARTSAFPTAQVQGFIIKGREQTRLLGSFARAIGTIASASSPFTQVAPLPQRKGSDFGGYPIDTTYMPDDSPIVAMNMQIPLVCESSELAMIEESMLLGVFSQPLYNTAALPNCTFSGVRSSGISVHEKSKPSIEILEKMIVLPELLGFADSEVQLTKGEDRFHSFDLDHEQRKLARDRDDWRKGRTLENVMDGIQIGNEQIAFGRVVLASGNSFGNFLGETVTEDNKYYSLFAEIQGGCPNRPSGLNASGTQCMAIVRTQCESFPEDTSAVYHEIYAPITTPLISCELQDFNFLWGRNFVADGELVSVAAGLYGQIRPTEAEVDAFENNVIPAALFSLGIIELAPS